jgi:hypothetical protein
MYLFFFCSDGDQIQDLKHVRQVSSLPLSYHPPLSGSLNPRIGIDREEISKDYTE